MIKYFKSVFLILLALCSTFLFSCRNERLQNEELPQYEKCLMLAEEYARSQISNMIDQQTFWGERFDNANGNFNFLDARVDKLEYELTYQGYVLYKFGSSYLAESPEDIFAANGWVLNENGWYSDERQRWLVFTDSETPEFIGCFRDEFTPNGNTKQFYEDIDRWLENPYDMD